VRLDAGPAHDVIDLGSLTPPTSAPAPTADGSGRSWRRLVTGVALGGLALVLGAALLWPSGDDDDRAAPEPTPIPSEVPTPEPTAPPEPTRTPRPTPTATPTPAPLGSDLLADIAELGVTADYLAFTSTDKLVWLDLRTGEFSAPVELPDPFADSGGQVFPGRGTLLLSASQDWGNGWVAELSFGETEVVPSRMADRQVVSPNGSWRALVRTDDAGRPRVTTVDRNLAVAGFELPSVAWVGAITDDGEVIVSAFDASFVVTDGNVDAAVDYPGGTFLGLLDGEPVISTCTGIERCALWIGGNDTEQARPIAELTAPVYGWAVSPRGDQLLAMSSGDGEVLLVSRDGSVRDVTAVIGSGAGWTIAWDPGGDVVAVVGPEDELQLISLSSGQTVPLPLPVRDNYVASVALLEEESS
jgi:hypothetical protein